jgi:hypothetical protein
MRYLGVLAFCVLLGLGAAPARAQDPTPTPAPTVCSVNGICGQPVIVAGYVDGSQGPEYLLIAVCLFGFSMLITLRFVELFVGRRSSS